MKVFAFALGSSLGLLTATLATAATTNLFFTQFEPGEGYNTATLLIGQPPSAAKKWIGQGNSGNGVTNNYVAGRGQQALVGRKATNPVGDVSVYYPVNFAPLAAGYPLVKFSTIMSVEDSTNGQYDNFYWSVFNTNGEWLFSLGFDNGDLAIKYDLDDTNGLVATGWSFDPNTDYTLELTLNFAANRWSAALGGAGIVTNLPMTTKGTTLTLGDIDAEWFPYDPQAPGNNFMLFDDYRITAESVPVPPAQVLFVDRTTGGGSVIRVSGQEGSRWALDGTTNLVQWTALRTNQIFGGYFEHVDATAAGLPRRFYRARLVP